MITAVDTNVLLDILLPEQGRAVAAELTLVAAQEAGEAVVCEVVYAELAAWFLDRGELDEFLSTTGVRLDHTSEAGLWQAGTAWKAYSANRGPETVCGQCGNRETVICSICGNPIRPRQHMLADFVIGAHALMQADRLLTRDRRTHRTYFPSLEVVAPS